MFIDGPLYWLDASEPVDIDGDSFSDEQLDRLGINTIVPVQRVNNTSTVLDASSLYTIDASSLYTVGSYTGHSHTALSGTLESDIVYHGVPLDVYISTQIVIALEPLQTRITLLETEIRRLTESHGQNGSQG